MIPRELLEKADLSEVCRHYEALSKKYGVERNAVIARLAGKNELLRLMGVEESPQRCIYQFRGRFLEKVTVEFPESRGLFDKKYKLFAEWAGREHPLEFKKKEAGGYTVESARLLLALAKEWRDRTSAETLCVEQELIKLENASG